MPKKCVYLFLCGLFLTSLYSKAFASPGKNYHRRVLACKKVSDAHLNCSDQHAGYQFVFDDPDTYIQWPTTTNLSALCTMYYTQGNYAFDDFVREMDVMVRDNVFVVANANNHLQLAAQHPIHEGVSFRCVFMHEQQFIQVSQINQIRFTQQLLHTDTSDQDDQPFNFIDYIHRPHDHPMHPSKNIPAAIYQAPKDFMWGLHQENMDLIRGEYENGLHFPPLGWGWQHDFSLLDPLIKRLAPNSTCLDIGTRSGETVKKMAGRGHQAYGIDILYYQQPNFSATTENVHFFAGRAQDLPFKNETFNLIVSNRGIQIDQSIKAFVEVLRTLKPSGTYYEKAMSTGGGMRFSIADNATSDLLQQLITNQYVHFRFGIDDNPINPLEVDFSVMLANDQGFSIEKLRSIPNQLLQF
ncbi:MAG: class I SAM-dependent methyltransferase [Deltaproteobacteria bacterium]|nr:class I SAM-dependent methyltransferase [Deltaproteobacteria bacterium]